MYEFCSLSNPQPYRSTWKLRIKAIHSYNIINRNFGSKSNNYHKVVFYKQIVGFAVSVTEVM